MAGDSVGVKLVAADSEGISSIDKVSPTDKFSSTDKFSFKLSFLRLTGNCGDPEDLDASLFAGSNPSNMRCKSGVFMR